MSGIPHDHTEFYDWCFRCSLHKDEIEAIRAEAEADAQKAWDGYQPVGVGAHRCNGQRNAFIAGYLASEFQ